MTVESLPRTPVTPLNSGDAAAMAGIEQGEALSRLQSRLEDDLEHMNRSVPSTVEEADSMVARVQALSSGFRQDERRGKLFNADLIDDLHEKADTGINLWRLDNREVADYAKLSQVRSASELSTAQIKRAEYMHGGTFTSKKELLEFIRSDAGKRLELDELIAKREESQSKRVAAHKTQEAVVRTSIANNHEDDQTLPDNIAERLVMELDGQLVEVRTTKNGQDWFYAMNEAGKLHRIGRATVDELAEAQEAQDTSVVKTAQPTKGSASSILSPEVETEARTAVARAETVFPKAKQRSEQGVEAIVAAGSGQDSDVTRAEASPELQTAPTDPITELTLVQRGLARALRFGRNTVKAAKSKAYMAHAVGTQKTQEYITLQKEKQENMDPATLRRNKWIGRAVLTVAGGVAAYITIRGIDTMAHMIADSNTAGADALGGTHVGSGIVGHDTIDAITAPDVAAPADPVQIPGIEHGGSGSETPTDKLMEVLQNNATDQVESGHGYTHELQELAAKAHYDLSPAQSYALYDHLESMFDGNFYTENVSYQMGNGDYGIGSTGRFTFRPEVIAEIAEWLEENTED